MVNAQLQGLFFILFLNFKMINFYFPILLICFCKYFELMAHLQVTAYFLNFERFLLKLGTVSNLIFVCFSLRKFAALESQKQSGSIYVVIKFSLYFLLVQCTPKIASPKERGEKKTNLPSFP
jgi:hypothetical protein